MKNNILKTLGVGFVKFIVLDLVTTGAMYYSLTNLNDYLWFALSVILALVHVVAFLYLHKSSSFGEILLMDFLSSCLSFVLTVLSLIVRNLVDFNIRPQYISEKLDDNYGAVIMILLSWFIYCVSVLVFKLVMLAVMAIIRFYKKRKRETTQISNDQLNQSRDDNQGTVL